MQLKKRKFRNVNLGLFRMPDASDNFNIRVPTLDLTGVRIGMRFLYFFLILIVAFGCGDEGALLDDITSAAPSADLPTIGPPPPEIATLLWGSEDAEIKKLKALLKNPDEKQLEHHDPTVLYVDRIAKIRALKKFYTKYIDASGIAIIGHRSVDDRFFHAGKHIILTMTSKRPELREALSAQTGFRMVLYDPVYCPEAAPDIQLAGYALSAWCNANWCVTTAQTNQDNSIYIQRTFVHEFAHAIHSRLEGIYVFPPEPLDPTFQARLEAAYAASKVPPLSQVQQRNVAEYWAVAVQEWFLRPDKVQDFATDPNGEIIPITWLDKIIENDPLLYALLDEWFPLVYLGSVNEEF